MMNVTVLAVGRLKEKYLTDGCAEYVKRLGSFCRLRVVEISEYRLPENPSPSEIALGLQKEGERLLAQASGADWIAALCIEGDMIASPDLSAALERCALSSQSNVCFIIGGSFGLSDQVKAAAQMRLSMSRMTFPHQLARLMLLEQIYRAFSISRGGKYHK